MFICKIIVVVANMRKIVYNYAGMHELYYCNATIRLTQSTGSLALNMR